MGDEPLAARLSVFLSRAEALICLFMAIPLTIAACNINRYVLANAQARRFNASDNRGLVIEYAKYVAMDIIENVIL